MAAALTVLPLLLIFFHLMRAGLGSLNPEFFTNVPAPVGESGGGVGNGVLGTFILVALAGAMGLPVAIGAGIYLAESEGGKMANVIRFITDVMNGIPSIVIGIFVWAWIVVSIGFSAFAGGVALAIMLIPMVTRTTEEMVRLVPRELKEGALALGFTRWRTTLGVVLPAARSGILTGRARRAGAHRGGDGAAAVHGVRQPVLVVGPGRSRSPRSRCRSFSTPSARTRSSTGRRGPRRCC